MIQVTKGKLTGCLGVVIGNNPFGGQDCEIFRLGVNDVVGAVVERFFIVLVPSEYQPYNAQ